MNNPPREDPKDRDMRRPQPEEHREAGMGAHEHDQTRDRDMTAAGHEHPHDGGYMWSGMGEYQTRFDQLKMDFIEHPKETVSKAEALAKEAVERMTSTMNDRLNRIHSELGDGKEDDTERMRVAMNRYREFMDSLSSRHAA